jgi:3-oxoacyl-(acyl-carrier-protein) synthase
MSGTAPQAIDMVLLAANNTSPLDSAEEKALQQVFMHHYATLKKRTTKHLIGETAAAGIFMNLAAAILEMDLLHATAAPVHGRKPDCHALCHSCHYSGSNAAVVLRKTCGAAPAAYIAASDSDLL